MFISRRLSDLDSIVTNCYLWTRTINWSDIQQRMIWSLKNRISNSPHGFTTRLKLFINVITLDGYTCIRFHLNIRNSDSTERFRFEQFYSGYTTRRQLDSRSNRLWQELLQEQKLLRIIRTDRGSIWVKRWNKSVNPLFGIVLGYTKEN